MGKRYIDADKFERAVMFSDDEDLQDVIYRLRDYPAADVVEVVRCRDCRYLEKMVAKIEGEVEFTTYLCRTYPVSREMTLDGFCSCGERKEDE